jgi:hypothetical protein
MQAIVAWTVMNRSFNCTVKDTLRGQSVSRWRSRGKPSAGGFGPAIFQNANGQPENRRRYTSLQIYLQRRWSEGCHNATKRFQEIRKQWLPRPAQYDGTVRFGLEKTRPFL